MVEYIRYAVEERVATITLDRADRANAQNEPFLQQLNEAWEKAAADESGVREIDRQIRAAARPMQTATELLGIHEWEAKHYLGYSKRWRDTPKPSIAAVQGACIAGGLLLAWPCDLIIAADDARFSDPVVLMGIGGVEYHGHTWELGPRKAKEMLFTAKPIDAHEAERRGMVNRVVPRAELDAEALALAREIAQMHPHALAMAKRAVNQTLDIMGQSAALQSCFDIHQLGHASAYGQTGEFIVAGMDKVKSHS